MAAVLEATRGLLDELEPLAPGVRTARLVVWARSNPGREAVCGELREQGEYERLLALLASTRESCSTARW
jgi:hypothetical protein